MNATVALVLTQDGLTSGLIYALLATSILLVFVVTRIFWIPAGEFVAFAALTFGIVQSGRTPSVIWLPLATGGALAIAEIWRAWRRGSSKGLLSRIMFALLLPTSGAAAMWLLVPMQPPVAVQVALVMFLLIPVGPLIYRLVFEPIEGASILTLLIVAVAVHYVLVGLGLVFFGPETFRLKAFFPGRIDLGFTRLSIHLLFVCLAAGGMMLVLWWFMERTRWGRGLRATAFNRTGAWLVGIDTGKSGVIAFALSSTIGVVSGILIGPTIPIFYDSGFSISLKGFIGAVTGGMASFPLAIAGALMVGLFESFASFFSSAYKEALVLILLAPILIWRSIGKADHEGAEE